MLGVSWLLPSTIGSCVMILPGDWVEINTTAVDLGLGTGGIHFVIGCYPQHRAEVLAARKGPAMAEEPQKPHGHIVKLRYTPLQLAVLSVEEEGSPYHSILGESDSLAGMPVMVASLHSLIAPIAVAFRHFAAQPARLAYLMTDGAALPLAFSKLAASLKEKGLIATTITAGHALERSRAVGIYSGLCSEARSPGGCLRECHGAWSSGTGTAFGTTALETAPILDAVNSLGGRAIAVPRISFADRRKRHQGLVITPLPPWGGCAILPAISLSLN